MKRVLKALFLFFFPAKADTALPEINAYPRDPSEPSPFVLSSMNKTGGETNPLWINWYMQKHGASFKEAALAAFDLRQELFHNPPKHNPLHVPDLLVAVKVELAGIENNASFRHEVESLTISLRWVLWIAVEYNIPLQEAHDYGHQLSGRY